MRSLKWLIAGGALALSGAALAGEGKDCEDKDHQHTKAEAKAWQQKSEAQEEGKEVRTSLEQGAEEAEQKAEEAKEGAKVKAAELGERSAGRAEAIGSGFAESAREATDAVRGEPSPLPQGELDDGEIDHTLTTNALGLLSGEGVNVTYSRSLSDKFSGVAGARYSRAASTVGAMTAFGVTVGGDYFLLGSNNEGLRIGPRVDISMGGTSLGDGGGFAGLGAAAELGYNWISSRGLTAGIGTGLRANVGGGAANRSDEDGNVADADVGSYAKINLGYSW